MPVNTIQSNRFVVLVIRFPFSERRPPVCASGIQQPSLPASTLHYVQITVGYVCLEKDRNAHHLQNECTLMAPKLIFCFCCVFCCFRIQTGTERGTQWAERARSRLTMSRKGKESSQEENSVLCRKCHRGNGGETQHNSNVLD